MRLQLEGVVQTGVSVLDVGITDFEVAVINGVVHLYASTGRNGGITEYIVGANGQITANTTVIFPANIAGTVSDDLVLAQDGSGLVLLVGNRSTGLIAYTLGEGGRLGGQVTQGWDDVGAAIDRGSDGHLAALVTQGDRGGGYFPSNFDASQVVELVSTRVSGLDYVVVANTETNSVVTYRVDPATGAMRQIDSMGAADGVGIDAPTALEVVSIGGHTYVILAAANTSSLSVMELQANGQLVAVDHVVDNGGTRFEGVQALAVAQVGGQVFVVAGGADSGITLFTLLPDGRLVALQTLADTADTSMHSVSAIEIAVDGDTLYIFVGSQNDRGVTTYTLDLASLGQVIEGSAAAERLTGTAHDDILVAEGSNDTLIGGSGDDVLVSGDGGTVMTGGAGADTYVIREASGGSTITDFEAGVDRLDMSDLPMLRDPSQLSITSTATGAILEYRGHVVVITSANGRPLTLRDLFPQGFDWGDHFDHYPIEDEDPPNPGVWRIGGQRAEYMVGTERDDTLDGGGGHDTIDGGDGNDWILGGGRKDLLFGGAGNDTLEGGRGRDTLHGGDGDDLLLGGAKGDRLFGGDGNDTLDGGTGRDLLNGGAGDDLIVDLRGKSKVYGGDGNDTIRTGDRNDTIYGDDGDDLVNAGDGNDSVRGGAGNDVMYGEGGDDSLYGDAGNDLIDGGAGNDQIWGGTGHDTLMGGGGNDQLRGEDGKDVVNGGNGNDQIWGGTGDDLLMGGAGNDAIWGDEGNDTIRGDDGDDWISGGAGDDVLYGGAGNDTLRGGSGNDVMWGGAGADVFEFFRDHDTGRVMDFNPDEGDIIRLDDWIWFSLGDLTAEEVVERFGSIDANGNVVLDFSDVGGNVVVLDGFDDLSALPDHIEII